MFGEVASGGMATVHLGRLLGSAGFARTVVIKRMKSELAEKLGIRNQIIERGEQASLFNSFQPWTPEEQAAAQRWVDAFYEDFITEVAQSRNLTKEQVDALAQGRVWSGAAAKEHKLLDELGTLLDAIDAARSKAGIAPGAVDAFVALCRDTLKLPLAGLMCIPPVGQHPAPHLALLAKIAARNNLGGLSMGMSGDFDTAIQCGATHVRIGTAIFGKRG